MRSNQAAEATILHADHYTCVKIGFQIYRCVTGAWSLKAPAAMVLNSERDGRTIYHYGGPTWQSMADGSLVTAARKAESAVAGAIPQLLMEVTSHGGTVDGELSKVTYIQRLNTSGGLAPAGSCVEGSEHTPSSDTPSSAMSPR